LWKAEFNDAAGVQPAAPSVARPSATSVENSETLAAHSAAALSGSRPKRSAPLAIAVAAVVGVAAIAGTYGLLRKPSVATEPAVSAEPAPSPAASVVTSAVPVTSAEPAPTVLIAPDAGSADAQASKTPPAANTHKPVPAKTATDPGAVRGANSSWIVR
jgi:hypothetical protein